jgi:hypothetical protein
MVHMRRVGLLCLIFVMPVVTHAQPKNDSWDTIRSLRVGEKIEVVDGGMKKHIGTFLMVSDESIQMREGSNEIGVRKENVARVSVLDKNHRLRNALIFAAVGGGAGAGIGALAAGSHGFLGRGPAAAVGAIIGVAVGAGLGAALPSHPTLYRANLPSANPPH